jgi:putative Mn2+ efflux pump MntP
VLGVFAAVTMATFVGLTVVAAAVGYQMRGEWLEDHANTITSVVLIAIGVVAYVGL